jgi:hypothetical protein
MKALFTYLGASVMLALILLPCSQSFCQTYYLHGDVNNDGWCNFADVISILEYPSQCANFNASAADADGNGSINGADAAFMAAFLRGVPNVLNGVSAFPIVTCDPNEFGYIELKQKRDLVSTTATFTVSIQSSTNISIVNFSFPYDPNIIASFSAQNVTSPCVIEFSSLNRPFVSPLNIMAVTINCWNNGLGCSFPALTPVFDLVLTAANPLETDLKIIDNDPIYGPPRFFFGPHGQLGCNSIFPFSPWQLVGDLNGDGVVNGLDISFGINTLHGGPGISGKWFWNIPVSWTY